MFGYVGSHRSGKTTTARAVAERMGVEYLDARVSEVFRDAGVDPKVDLPFFERLDLQNKILDALEIQYRLRAGTVFVTDRTPYDVMAYTLADIRRGSIAPDERERVASHLCRGMDIGNEHLRAVLLLAPILNAPDAPGKAPACPFYMGHMHMVMQGVLDAYTDQTLADVSRAYDLDERIEEGVALFTKVRDFYMPEVKIWTPNS